MYFWGQYDFTLSSTDLSNKNLGLDQVCLFYQKIPNQIECEIISLTNSQWTWNGVINTCEQNFGCFVQNETEIFYNEPTGCEIPPEHFDNGVEGKTLFFFLNQPKSQVIFGFVQNFF